MRRKTLAREFLQLSKYDFLTVAALRLRDRPSIRRIVERIEAPSPKFTDVFFSFEVLDTLEKGLNEDSPGEHHSVMAYNPDAEKWKIQNIIQTHRKRRLDQNETISVLGLYAKMANISFRAQNSLFFDILKVEDAILCKAINPLSRIFFIEKEVLTLHRISVEE